MSQQNPPLGALSLFLGRMLPQPKPTHVTCPAKGCGRKARLLKNGKIGAHYWFGHTKCASVGMLPKDAQGISAIG